MSEYEWSKYYRQYLIDQGMGHRTVQFKAWRITIPHVFGYGMTVEEAIHDLIQNVQPVRTGPRP